MVRTSSERADSAWAEPNDGYILSVWARGPVDRFKHAKPLTACGQRAEQTTGDQHGDRYAPHGVHGDVRARRRCVGGMLGTMRTKCSVYT